MVSTVSPTDVPQARRRPRLHLFDLDGTLIRGSAAAVEISRQLGVEKEIAELERDFADGRLSPPEFAERACALWAELREEHVAAAFAGAPWLGGIREVWDDIRQRGDRCAVISLSPDFFVHRMCAGCSGEAPPGRDGQRGRGADLAYGSRWPAVPFRRPLDPAGILTPAAKVKIANELCEKFGVLRSDCVAYGDSMSDAPLFRSVPVSVAVNADGHLRGLATSEYRGDDLRDAYGLVCYGR